VHHEHLKRLAIKTLWKLRVPLAFCDCDRRGIAFFVKARVFAFVETPELAFWTLRDDLRSVVNADSREQIHPMRGARDEFAGLCALNKPLRHKRRDGFL
jgi:hypothetical protein